MDLLGSILGKMEPIPTSPVDEETKKKIKEAKANAAKFKEMERKRKANFKAQIEERVNAFLQGPADIKKLILEPMDKLHRSITHEVADTAGLSSYSFGEEDVDRHLILWKKEFAPCDDELEAIRNGEEYDPEKVPAPEKSKVREPIFQEKETRKRNCDHNEGEQDKYVEKYAKIVGADSGIKAAHVTKLNIAYGMVPSTNKTDTRSIEETMKQIRERKKQQQSSELSANVKTTTEDIS